MANIVAANEVWISEIEKWLVEEEQIYSALDDEDVDEEKVRGFLCNWEMVKRSWRSGQGRIDVLLQGDDCVGFLWDYDILEIKPSERKKGYGRILAESMIKRAIAEGRSVVEIEIAPPSAVPFWRSQGFTDVPDRKGGGGGIYAFKELPRIFSLPDGYRVPFLVEFFTERARYSDLPPFKVYAGLGTVLANGSVQLPERACCHGPKTAERGDDFVKLSLNNEVVFFDKMKRAAAKNYGIQQDEGHIYYIEQITPQRVVMQ